MKRFLLLLFCIVTSLQLIAQKNITIDSNVFSDVVFSEPNPPKPIKGWELVQSEQDGKMILIGEYPGKIIKFQFRGNAVGIEIETAPESGIIEYSIDASEWEKLDLYKDAANNESLYYTLGKDLKNRKHTLQIRVTNEQNVESIGNKCKIIHFYFNAPE